MGLQYGDAHKFAEACFKILNDSSAQSRPSGVRFQLYRAGRAGRVLGLAGFPVFCWALFFLH